MSKRWITITRREPEPDWEPLELLLESLDLCSYFVWIGPARAVDGSAVQIYKHRSTRACLNLSGDGRAFCHVGGDRYVEAERARALEAAFNGWTASGPERYERLALRMAIERARASDRAAEDRAPEHLASRDSASGDRAASVH